jgi:hypothetical protein
METSENAANPDGGVRLLARDHRQNGAGARVALYTFLQIFYKLCPSIPSDKISILQAFSQGDPSPAPHHIE